MDLQKSFVYSLLVQNTKLESAGIFSLGRIGRKVLRVMSLRIIISKPCFAVRKVLVSVVSTFVSRDTASSPLLSSLMPPSV